MNNLVEVLLQSLRINKKLISLAIVCLLFSNPISAGHSHSLDKKNKRIFVLSIGIANFKDSHWDTLKFTDKDAIAIDSFFNEQTKDNYQTAWKDLLVASKEKKTYVTDKEVLQAMERLKKDNTSDQDVIIIYVSTHGTIYENQGSGKLSRYIVTSNTDYNNVDQTAIAYESLMELFHSFKSKRKVLILDTCYSGTGKSLLTEKTKIELSKQKGGYFDEDEIAEGEILMFSAQKSEPSIEDPALGHSVYTNFLLEGFRKDLNNDGAVTITEAHLYARNMTREFTKNQQNPTAKIVIEGVDPIVINGQLQDTSLAYVYNRWTARSNYLVKVDGENIGMLDKGFSVESGKRRITIIDPLMKKTIADRSIRFQGGKEYTIEDMIFFPDHPHLADAQLKSLSFTSPYMQDYWVPNKQYGIGFRYTHQDLYKTYDFGLALTLYRNTNENPKLDSHAMLSQKRELFTIFFSLGSRERIAFLSTQNNRIQSNLAWGLGPSIMGIKLSRTYSSPTGDPIEPINQERKYYTGVSVFAGPQIEVPTINLRAGIEIETSLWNSPFEGQHNYILSYAPSVFIGYHW
ncbi:MAG: caspase family protein [Oligoflexia bacterium]|nr:caspase family protein [Oligoflexia bacterium]